MLNNEVAAYFINIIKYVINNLFVLISDIVISNFNCIAFFQ